MEGNVYDELTAINDLETKQMEVLPNMISSTNADAEELNEKDEQRSVPHQSSPLLARSLVKDCRDPSHKNKPRSIETKILHVK